MSTIIEKMIRMRSHARIAHCHIKRWRLTDGQALMLADEIAGLYGTTLQQRYESMRAGNAFAFGVPIEVKPASVITSSCCNAR